MSHDLVEGLKTPDECAAFEHNAVRLGDLSQAVAARKRAVKLRALQHGAQSGVECECLEAVYAYEDVLRIKNGKKTRATRTWQMIKKYGILEAVERAVNRSSEAVGYTLLVEAGLENYAFEAVIVRHAEQFPSEAVQRSKARLAAWQAH